MIKSKTLYPNPIEELTIAAQNKHLMLFLAMILVFTLLLVTRTFYRTWETNLNFGLGSAWFY